MELDRTTGGPAVNQFMQTNLESVFACGNVVHVNDLVDNVTEESLRAGAAAAKYAAGTLPKAENEIPTVPGNHVRYICPQRLNKGADATLFFRVTEPAKNVTIRVLAGEEVILSKKALRVNPGEMEHVNVKADQIKNAASVTIEVV